MAKIEWTPVQRQAIDTTDKSLLVSAAAGSGKTATLVERIVRSVFRHSDPINTDELLIVTYTRAAAQELREKLAKRYREEIDSLPKSVRNERQLIMLDSARICTIDSYCAELVRQSAEKLDLPPTFRIPDEAEVALLSENLLGGIFNEIYEGRMDEVATAEELFALSDCLTDTGRQDDLAPIIFKIYGDTQSTEEGVYAIDPLIEEYSPQKFDTVEGTHLGSYCMKLLRTTLSHHRGVFESALEELRSRGMAGEPLTAQVIEGLSLIKSLDAAEGYEAVRTLLCGELLPGKAVSLRDKTLPPTTLMRNALRDDLTELYKKFFIYSAEDWRVCYAGLYPILDTLRRVVRKFDAVLSEEKRSRGICEYSDIERYAYRLLTDNGRLTDLALAQREKLRAVYIDEYQDVNNLQNKIFEAVSHPTARFMVGDIKQSIYRFRSANPEIFAGMKKTYPKIEESDGSDAAALFMSDNFRCDRGVVDFVNLIFDRAFGLMRESIGYVEEDRLGFAKVKEGETEPPYRKPEICLVDSSALGSAHRKLGIPFDEGILAPAVVAQKISELISEGRKNDGTPIEPQDIAIIMRRAKGRAPKYKEALDRLGIRCELAEESAFFLTPEARLALCLLNSVDNPHKDIYLAGLMMSPLYSFGADELTKIRAAGGESLYSALCAHCANNADDTHACGFLRELKRYRTVAEGMATDRLIMRLYHETGLLALGARLGGKERLMQLYEYARSFEGSSFRGLYSFINYLNGIIDRKHSLDKREAPKSTDSVKIITTHSSKGLEYPVVFYVDCEKPFGRGGGGAAPRFEYEENFGFGMMLRTPSGLSLVNNATREVIKDYRRRRDIEEEARILYVGLTRARERLYLVCNAGKKLEDFAKEVSFRREYLSEHLIYKVGSPLGLVLAANDFALTDPLDFLKALPRELRMPDCAGDGIYGSAPAPVLQISSNADDCSVLSGSVDAEELIRRFNYSYPTPHLTSLPEKLSVSVLYPQLLDGAESETADADIMKRDRSRLRFSGIGIKPKFLSEKHGATATERGIATHQYLQFCDLQGLVSSGADAELERLVREGFLTRNDASRLRLDEVEKFRNSNLLSKMLKAKRLWRELRFNVRLPAELFVSDPEDKKRYAGTRVLVQGVIDCLFEDGDGRLCLVDYKTDRLNGDELRDPALAAKKMREAHSLQLSYYALAVKQMFGKEPDSRQIYSLQLGDVLDV